MSGFFAEALWSYGVTYNIGRGYDSWSSIKATADRLMQHELPLIFYFGDFDPSGEDMAVSLQQRLRWFNVAFEIETVALTRQDIDDYNLPPNFTKRSDTRAARHIALHGDISVELDALPVDVLRRRIVDCVEQIMNLDALEKTRRRERAERRQIARRLGMTE